MIANEIAKQMHPLNQAVADVKAQNDQQNAVMAQLVEWRRKSEQWCVKLWSNGSGGPPGYLEVAREEDNRRYRRLFEEISELKAESLREEGKEDLRREMEQTRIDLEKLADVKKTGRWTRFHKAVLIATTLGGAFSSYVFHPALHAFAVWLARGAK